MNKAQEAFSVLVNVADKSIASGVLNRKEIVIVNDCINELAKELDLTQEPLQKVEDADVQSEG